MATEKMNDRRSRWQIAAEYLMWREVQRLAPEVPPHLMRGLVPRVWAETPPAIAEDPIACIEFQIERIVELGREYLRYSEASRQIGESDPSGRHTLFYRSGWTYAGHDDCRTALPAAICQCGRFLLALRV